MEVRDYQPAELWAETLEMLGGPGMLLVTTDSKGRPNAMTIGWAQYGILWGKPVLTVFVRPSRYTYELLEQVSDFTVNLAGLDQLEALHHCGSASGRDHDKLAACGLTPIPARHTRSPILQECLLHYECRVLHRSDLVPAALDEDVKSACYPRGDFHRLYFGEVLAVYGRTDLKQELVR